MVNTPTNSTGWEYLIQGELPYSVYYMFDQTVFGGMGLFVIVLFVIFQIMLYFKTGNLTSMWVIGILFASMYGLSQLVNPLAVNILFGILVFELAGILLLMYFVKR